MSALIVFQRIQSLCAQLDKVCSIGPAVFESAQLYPSHFSLNEIDNEATLH